MNPLARAWADTRRLTFSSEKLDNGLELYIAAEPHRTPNPSADHLDGRLP